MEDKRKRILQWHPAFFAGLQIELSEELTISFVCSRYPRELMRYLEQEKHRVIEQKEDGIYYIPDELFPVQLIVTKQLPEETNLWLKSLTNDLETDRAAEQLLRAYEKHQAEELYQSVMDVVVHANEERFMVSDMCEALEEIIKDRIEEREKLAESRGIEQGEQQKILALIKKKIGKGKSVAQIADELEETEEVILPLYNRLKAEEGKCF